MVDGVPAGLDAVAAGLHADQPDAGIIQEGVEDADGVGPAADAGHHRVGQPAGHASTCARASRPMMRCKSRTISGNGCGPLTVPNR